MMVSKGLGKQCCGVELQQLETAGREAGLHVLAETHLVAAFPFPSRVVQ